MRKAIIMSLEEFVEFQKADEKHEGAIFVRKDSLGRFKAYEVAQGGRTCWPAISGPYDVVIQ